jgi:hypothetical protein
MEYKVLQNNGIDYTVFCKTVSSNGNWMMFWDQFGTLVHACSSDFIRFINIKDEEED